MAKSTATKTQRKRRSKPQKPRPDFPLFPHASGKWAKTVRGKTHYFGRWDDPAGAEAEYLKVAEDLHAGRKPGATSGDGRLTVAEACNHFLKAFRTKVDAGSRSERTFHDYHQTCQLLTEIFGRNREVEDLRPDDFTKLYDKLVKSSPASIRKHITQVRMVFRHAAEAEMIDKLVKFGPVFKAPSKADERKARAKKKNRDGSRTFTAEQIRQMLDGRTVKDDDGKEQKIPGAPPQLRAMILLGINCGFGNTDIASLPISAMDLDNGWIDYPRPKTGVERRCPLWPETVEALKEVLKTRKKPASEEDAGIVFVTKYRLRWVRHELVEETKYGKMKVTMINKDAIAQQTAKLLKELGIKRPGLSFYSLRHTFETIAGNCKDQVAVDCVMGHSDPSMAATYRHGIDDDRLRDAVNHVHQWLFGEEK